MSLAMDQIRKTVEARISELGPVILELEQLQNILALLDGHEGSRPSGGKATADEILALHAQLNLQPPQPIRRSRRGTKPGRDGRAPQGANKKLIIEAVSKDPGITATEIAERTGIKRTVVSATINRLKRNGELEADGRGVRVASGRVLPALTSLVAE
jgi:hypothetical protein